MLHHTFRVILCDCEAILCVPKNMEKAVKSFMIIRSISAIKRSKLRWLMLFILHRVVLLRCAILLRGQPLGNRGPCLRCKSVKAWCFGCWSNFLKISESCKDLQPYYPVSWEYRRYQIESGEASLWSGIQWLKIRSFAALWLCCVNMTCRLGHPIDKTMMFLSFAADLCVKPWHPSIQATYCNISQCFCSACCLLLSMIWPTRSWAACSARHLEVVQLAQEGFNKLEEVQKSTLPSIKDAPSILKDLKKDISDALNMHVKIKAAEKLDGQQQAEALLGMLGLPPKATLSQMNKEMVRWSLRLHSDKLQPLLADAKLPAIAKVNALEVYQLLRGMFETVKKHLFPAEQLVLTPVDHLKVTSGEDEHGRRFMELTYGSLDDEEVRRGTAIVVDIPDPFPRDEPALHELLPLEDEDCTSALRIYEEDYSMALRSRSQPHWLLPSCCLQNLQWRRRPSSRGGGARHGARHRGQWGGRERVVCFLGRAQAPLLKARDGRWRWPDFHHHGVLRQTPEASPRRAQGYRERKVRHLERQLEEMEERLAQLRAGHKPPPKPSSSNKPSQKPAQSSSKPSQKPAQKPTQKPAWSNSWSGSWSDSWSISWSNSRSKSSWSKSSQHRNESWSRSSSKW